jgi:hypothetical protein
MENESTLKNEKPAGQPVHGSRDWARWLMKIFGTNRGLEFIGRNLTLLQAAAEDANREHAESIRQRDALLAQGVRAAHGYTA